MAMRPLDAAFESLRRLTDEAVGQTTGARAPEGSAPDPHPEGVDPGVRKAAGILAFHGSYHFEFTDTDRFLANARVLSEHGIDGQIRPLAHPGIPPAFLEPVICPFDACGCPDDIAISKLALPADPW
jgi:hypothetical protein